MSIRQMNDFITNANEFENGNEAVEYALEHQPDAPLDELSDDELRTELSMLEVVLEWEQAQHNSNITGRVTVLETALAQDEEFDVLEHDRKGSKYLDQHDNLVILDGTLDENAASITYYHYIVIPNSGEVGRADEARKTFPEDEDTQWLSVTDLDAYIANGMLRPARVVPENRETQ